jgi:pimeloyl-ACP methyl ester carboxylesterase
VVTPSDTAPPDTAPPANAAPEIPPGFEQWYNQPLTWETCDWGWQCATISAPLSWGDPGAGAIELALKMRPAEGEKLGTLVLNPGGPGSSGLSFVTAAVDFIGEPVLQAYDILGFDPRGIGESAPVRCFDDERKDWFISTDFTPGAQGRPDIKAAAEEFAAACADNTGLVLGEIDSQSTARDMDLIRHLVGDTKLNYLGYSYGTLLGAYYAGLFPHNVGAMVLDGAIDITLGFDESARSQAKGFENALNAYVTYCQENAGCPLTGTVSDGMAQIEALFQEAFEHTIPTGTARALTRNLALLGVAVTLYDEMSWPILTQALEQAINQGNGYTLLMLADWYNDRLADGSFSTNSQEAFIAISCLDGRGATDPEIMDANNTILSEYAPTIGIFFHDGGLMCWGWPHPEVEIEFDIHAPGAAPILVIGTTGDPATPYEEAVALAATLDSGVLLTYNGEGHGAYGRSNECIMETVDEFLVAGVIPEPNRRC